MFKRAAVLVVSCGAVLAGCGADPLAENEEIISNLIEAGVPANDIKVSEGAVYVGHDAHVSLQASREMLQPGEGSAEHYRTANLVGTSVTKICLIPSSVFNSYSRLSQGLDLAIQNYNELGLRIYFGRAPTSGCTANIHIQLVSGSTGGSAGFPANDLPYNTIFVGSGLQNYSLDVNEHVITHLIGHTIGLLHSDYYGQGTTCGGTRDSSYGLTPIHIPGTPTTSTLGGSLMNSCFRSTETGEFTSSDKTALHSLY